MLSETLRFGLLTVWMVSPECPVRHKSQSHYGPGGMAVASTSDSLVTVVSPASWPKLLAVQQSPDPLGWGQRDFQGWGSRFPVG